MMGKIGFFHMRQIPEMLVIRLIGFDSEWCGLVSHICLMVHRAILKANSWSSRNSVLQVRTK